MGKTYRYNYNNKLYTLAQSEVRSYLSKFLKCLDKKIENEPPYVIVGGTSIHVWSLYLGDKNLRGTKDIDINVPEKYRDVVLECSARFGSIKERKSPSRVILDVILGNNLPKLSIYLVDGNMIPPYTTLKIGDTTYYVESLESILVRKWDTYLQRTEEKDKEDILKIIELFRSKKVEFNYKTFEEAMRFYRLTGYAADKLLLLLRYYKIIDSRYVVDHLENRDNREVLEKLISDLVARGFIKKSIKNI